MRLVMRRMRGKFQLPSLKVQLKKVRAFSGTAHRTCAARVNRRDGGSSGLEVFLSLPGVSFFFQKERNAVVRDKILNLGSDFNA